MSAQHTPGPTMGKARFTQHESGAVTAEYDIEITGDRVERTFFVRGAYVHEHMANGQSRQACKGLATKGVTLHAPSSGALIDLIRREYKAMRRGERLMSTRNVSVSLSAAQLAEAQHKATIICEELDLLESYEISQEQADALRDKLFAAAPGRLELMVHEAELLAGELENSAEIDECNLEDGDEASRGSLISMKDAVRKLRAAIAKTTGENHE